jgi:CubicO group peptidase (beta-lactamase class C family)
MAEVRGRVKPGLEPVWVAFAEMLSVDPAGAALAVDLDGEMIVDLWGGARDADRGLSWERGTLVHTYSVTKPFAAMALLLLVDRGAVGLDDPVVAYWPEFAAEGKAGIPVRWLLTHQAGLEVLSGPQPPEVLLDWDRFCAEVSGVSPALARDARWQRALGNPPGVLDPEVVNGSAYRAAEVPAVNGHGTARAVARFYGALLGGELLSESLRNQALYPQASGIDEVVGEYLSWGLGLQVDDDGFGMGGVGGAFGGASRTGRYGISFLPAHMDDHERLDRLEEVVRECLSVPPLE